MDSLTKVSSAASLSVSAPIVAALCNSIRKVKAVWRPWCMKGPGGAVWGVSSPPPRQAFVVPGAAQPDAADGDDAECAPPPPVAAWASAASGAASGAAASGGGGKGKKKKGRDASHLLGFTSERADAVGADED